MEREMRRTAELRVILPGGAPPMMGPASAWPGILNFCRGATWTCGLLAISALLFTSAFFFAASAFFFALPRFVVGSSSSLSSSSISRTASMSTSLSTSLPV